MKLRDVLDVLAQVGCELKQTAGGHYLVRRPGVRGAVTIATDHRGEVGKKYLSRLRNQLRIGEDVQE